MKTLLLIMILIIAGCQYTSAAVCSCEFSENRFNEAIGVFYGKVIEHTRTNEKQEEIIKVKVEKAFKGNFSGIIILNSAYICSYNFQVGENYLIYAGMQENGLLETAPCRILYEKLAKQEMKYLEKGKKPKSPSKYKN